MRIGDDMRGLCCEKKKNQTLNFGKNGDFQRKAAKDAKLRKGRTVINSEMKRLKTLRNTLIYILYFKIAYPALRTSAPFAALR
jgi:hypothetical protein